MDTVPPVPGADIESEEDEAHLQYEKHRAPDLHEEHLRAGDHSGRDDVARAECVEYAEVDIGDETQHRGEGEKEPGTDQTSR